MAIRGGNEFTAPEAVQKTGRRTTCARFAALFASLLLVACNVDSKPRAWPEGTVLAIDDVPVTSDEVAQDMLAVLLIEPQWVDAQLKRLTFNEITLQRALSRLSVSMEVRDRARVSIDEEFARITSGTQIGPHPTPGVFGREVFGTWGELGMVAWGTAMNLPDGEWSEVLEEPGAFVRVRVLERQPARTPAETRLRLERIEAVYAPNSRVGRWPDAALQSHRLTIVDPAWDKIVPERTKFLMGAQP